MQISISAQPSDLCRLFMKKTEQKLVSLRDKEKADS